MNGLDIACSIMENHAYGVGFATDFCGSIPPLGKMTLVSVIGGDVYLQRRTKATGNANTEAEIWQRTCLPLPAPNKVALRAASCARAAGVLVAAAFGSAQHPNVVDFYTCEVDNTGKVTPWTHQDTIDNADPAGVQCMAVDGERSGRARLAAAVSVEGRPTHFVYDVSDPQSKGRLSFLSPLAQPVADMGMVWEGGNPAPMLFALSLGDETSTVFRYDLNASKPVVKRIGAFEGARAMACLASADGTHLVVGGSKGLDHVDAKGARASDASTKVIKLRASFEGSYLKVWYLSAAPGDLCCKMLHKGVWSVATRLAEAVNDFALMKGGAEQTELVWADSLGRTIHHWMDPATLVPMGAPVVFQDAVASSEKAGTHEMKTFTLQAVPDGTRRFISYKVMASQEARLQINGQYFALAPNTSVAVAPDPRGGLSMIGLMTSLSAPVLRIAGVEKSGDAPPVEVYPSSELKAKLAAATKDDLINLGVPDKYATDGLKAIQDLVGKIQVKGEAAAGDGPRTLILARQWSDPIDNRIFVDHPGEGFVFDFVEGSYTADPEAVRRGLAELLPSRPGNDLLSELLDALTSGWQYVKKLVVETVTGGFHFVLETIDDVIDVVVHTVEQAWAVVTRIFEAIGAYFKTLFWWLAFLFNWKEIINTQKVISHLLTLTLKEVPKRLAMDPSLPGAADPKTLLDWLKEHRPKQVPSFKVDGKDFGSFAKASTILSSLGVDNPRANWAYNHLMSGSFDGGLEKIAARSAERRAALAAPSGTQLLADHPDLKSAVEKTRALMKVVMSDGTGTDVSTLASGALEDVYDPVMDGMARFVDELKKLLAEAAKAVTDELTYGYDIPIVTWLYRQATGGDLSLLNLLSLLTAVGATVAHLDITRFAGHERPPFDERMVKEILTTSDLTAFIGKLFSSAEGDAAIGDGRHLAVALVTGFAGLLSLGSEIIAVRLKGPALLPYLFSAIGIGLGLAASIYDHNNGETEVERFVAGLQIIQTVIGVLMDIIAAYWEEKEAIIGLIRAIFDALAGLAYCVIDEVENLGTHVLEILAGIAETGAHFCVPVVDDPFSALILGLLIAIASGIPAYLAYESFGTAAA